MSVRNDRRRRLVTDDARLSDAEDAPPLRIAPATAATYAPAARADQQPRLTDVFPLRLRVLALIVTLPVLLAGLFELLHFGAPALAGVFEAEELAALGLAGERTLGHWYCSTLLGISGLLALLIFSLRRHRIDDYHGRYRVWLLVAAVCLLGSLAETTDLGRMAHGICRRAATASSVDEGVVWPTTVVALAGLLAVRWGFELRRSRLALAMLVLSVMGFATAVVLQQGWHGGLSVERALAIDRGAWLLGNVFVLATMLSYGRYVRLEIDGAAFKSKVRRTKKKTVASDTAQDGTAKPALQVRAERETSEKPAAKPASSPRETVSMATEKANQEEAENLSRAERRRLRRAS